ncbi:hypothetical protein BDQ12DRAFT_682957 [Crucibulum laeve]|uniref:DUF4203 domain-containing protein n=1 Tax=Crucibulum laeve TaxID=68775 RepID=A0A5C3M375_9AGAR|nr:hypothetical protein BDQ12DRAFT_682957 [Crucibulum laeve]
MADSSVAKLTDLLSSTSYVLTYALPLLLLSLVLTFAGTFLTLDRSRSFPPRGPGYTALPIPGAFDSPKKKKFAWMLEGGVGGLAGGYTFGLHLSTFLALLIPAKSNSSSLSSQSFLAVWLLSCIVTTPLGGRYRYAALVMLSLAGGTLISLGLSVIVHPSLSPRVVLCAVLAPLFTLLTLFAYFIPRFHTRFLHPMFRICTASTGAFGVVLALSLLLHPQEEGWANVWDRLWVPDGPGWGKAREKGLSAAWGVFFIFGMAGDWGLRRWFGECPDEKWDNYLANYAANLPNHADRAGTFQPLTSFWDRMFAVSALSTPTSSKDVIFPSDADMKSKSIAPITTHMNIGKLQKGALPRTNSTHPEFELPVTAAFLRKKSRACEKHRFRKDRKPVKFGAIDDLSSDSEEDEENVKKRVRPWLLSDQPSLSFSSSTPTLVNGVSSRGSRELKDVDEVVQNLDYDKELEALKKAKGGDDVELEYSDYEEDLTNLSPNRRARGETGEGKWSPGFLQRHQSPPTSHMPPPGAVPVPATPSLIKAMDRIVLAQRDAFGPVVESAVPPNPYVPVLRASTAPSLMRKPDGMPRTMSSPISIQARKDAKDEEDGDDELAIEEGIKKRKGRSPRWEDFWREVRTKAQAQTQA